MAAKPSFSPMITGVTSSTQVLSSVATKGSNQISATSASLSELISHRSNSSAHQCVTSHVAISNGSRRITARRHSPMVGDAPIW